MNSAFDSEFKTYLYSKGINIDPNLFDVTFNPPQNFASYRQAEMDGVRINTFGSIVALPFISKRYALKRFLGLKQEEIAENQEMWEEENLDTTKPISASAELRSAGITAGGMGGDMDSLGQSDLGTPEMQGADGPDGTGNAAMAPSAGSESAGKGGAPQGPM
jgi:hypothetical protein